MQKEFLTLPMVPLRGMVVFPNTISNFEVARETSVKALEKAMENDAKIFLAAQRNPRVEEPQLDDIYMVGTVCKIRYILHMPGGMVRVLVEGLYRGALEGAERTSYYEARVKTIAPMVQMGPKISAYMRLLITRYEEYGAISGKVTPEAIAALEEIESPEKLVDTIAVSFLRGVEEKQQVLEITDTDLRLNSLIQIVEQEIEIAAIESEISQKTKQRIDQSQREHYLREQMRAIQSSLGEDVEAAEDVQKIKDFLEKAPLDKETKDKLNKEVARMERMNPQSPDYSVLLNYFDWIMDLPFGIHTEDSIDIAHAKAVLDKDHYGMEKVKNRILEHLAVLKQTGRMQGNILCFIGPPGVGKTSIARSIAQAVNRKFVRMSLGGVRDEAEIRGHRRTYIGAIPGRIISNMRRAGSMNPVFLLDEIDKMSNDFRGDPASAMLEVLDESVNKSFQDHYLDIDFDLSEVMFIATANNEDEIPAPLYDRMEIIELDSYTPYEKEQIAIKHLIPKQFEKHNLTKQMLTITPGAIKEIIRGYTIESGVRTLERRIGEICRKATRMYVETGKKITVNKSNLAEFLGKKKYQDTKLPKKAGVGIAIGLAWTYAGGTTLPIEVVCMDGSGNIELTGQLGDVMKESAKTAISLVRANAKKLGIEEDFYKTKDIHIHIPEGGIPKDGPSAGITMGLAVASALSGKKVRRDIAMTGEVTLIGRVLPIGGLREKVFAAYRAGIKNVILPQDNEVDIDDIPAEIRDKVTFWPVTQFEQVLELGLEKR